MKETMNRFKHHENEKLINIKQIPEIYNTIKSILYNKTEEYYIHQTAHVFQKFKLYMKQVHGIPDYYKMQFKLKNYQLPQYQQMVDFWKKEVAIDIRYLHFSTVLRRYIDAFYNDVETYLFHEYLLPMYFQNENSAKMKWTQDDGCPYKFDFSNPDRPVKVMHAQNRKFGRVEFPQLHAFDYI
uniref:Uncharacterized protein n=1 Tax=Cacopsylla melanoneura TaxID=428564 RepID=A0A8D9BKM7_9HEMI